MAHHFLPPGIATGQQWNVFSFSTSSSTTTTDPVDGCHLPNNFSFWLWLSFNYKGSFHKWLIVFLCTSITIAEQWDDLLHFSMAAAVPGDDSRLRVHLHQLLARRRSRKPWGINIYGSSNGSSRFGTTTTSTQNDTVQLSCKYIKTRDNELFAL